MLSTNYNWICVNYEKREGKWKSANAAYFRLRKHSRDRCLTTQMCKGVVCRFCGVNVVTNWMFMLPAWEFRNSFFQLNCTETFLEAVTCKGYSTRKSSQLQELLIQMSASEFILKTFNKPFGFNHKLKYKHHNVYFQCNTNITWKCKFYSASRFYLTEISNIQIFSWIFFYF